MKNSAVLLASLAAMTSAGALVAENKGHLRNGMERTRRRLGVYPNDRYEREGRNCEDDELYISIKIETDNNGDELAVYLIKEDQMGSEFILSGPAMTLSDDEEYDLHEFCVDDDSDNTYHFNIASIDGDGIQGFRGEIELQVARFVNNRRELGFVQDSDDEDESRAEEEESVSFTFDNDGVTIDFEDNDDNERDCGSDGDRGRCGEDFDYVTVSFDKNGWDLKMFEGDDVELDVSGDYN